MYTDRQTRAQTHVHIHLTFTTKTRYMNVQSISQISVVSVSVLFAATFYINCSGYNVQSELRAP